MLATCSSHVKIEATLTLPYSIKGEEYNDIFNNKKYAAEAAQNHYNVLNDTVESLRSTVLSPSSSSPFICSRRGQRYQNHDGISGYFFSSLIDGIFSHRVSLMP